MENETAPSVKSTPFTGAAALGLVGGVMLPVLTVMFNVPHLIFAVPVLAGGLVALHAATIAAERRRRDYLLAHVRKTSVRDTETGTTNRTGFYLLGHQMLEQVRRRGDAIHAFVADISTLTRGGAPLDPAASSRVMKAVGAALNDSVRGTDVVARWDREQFVVVGPGTGVHPGELERRVRSHLEAGEALEVDNWPARITVGQASLAPWDGGDLDTLVQKAQADFTMRRAMRTPQSPQAFFGRTGTPKAS